MKIAGYVGCQTNRPFCIDYGAFTPIQGAAACALDSPLSGIENIRQTYQTRRDILVKTFARAGWQIPPPPASMFAWAKIPDMFGDVGSLEFARQLLQGAEIAVSPGIGFGEYGDSYVRIALVENEQRIRQAARNLKKFLDYAKGAPPLLNARARA